MRFWKIYLAAMVLRVTYAFWNGFWGPAPGAEFDAQGFIFAADSIANETGRFAWGSGAELYINFLALVFTVTGTSVVVASLLSVAAWSIAATAIWRAIGVTTFGRASWKPFAIFALMPFSIAYTSIQLREPYQLMFGSLMALSMVRVLMNGKQVYWLLLITSAVGFGCLHGALAVAAAVSVCMTVLCFFMITMKQSKLIVFNIAFVISLALLAAYFVFHYLSSLSGYDLSGGLLRSAEGYQKGLDLNARADYRTSIGGGLSLSSLIATCIGAFQYMLEPLPWHIASAQDGVLFIENIIRAYSLIFVLKYGGKCEAKAKGLAYLLILCYLVTEGIWSIGTVNWGTASRHHIPATAFLVVAFGIVSSSPRHLRNRVT